MNRREAHVTSLSYHDGKIAWIEWLQEGRVIDFRIHVRSLLHGHILCGEQTGVDQQLNVTLSSCMVAVAGHGG